MAVPSPSSGKGDRSPPRSGDLQSSSTRSCRPLDQESASDSASSSPQNGEAPERRDIDILAQVLSTKSEEYRLMFRLPHGEVLVQDFNCAIQENILLQGHMYLFIHHICFYSNIFGFETKRVISYYDVMGVRKSKTAAIFPNAIEISVADKKHFFGSFLSRDEAYKLIVEGWQHHSSDARVNLDGQDSKSESNGPETAEAVFEREDDIASQANCTDFIGSVVINNPEIHENGENGCSSFDEGWSWRPEDADAPKVPDYFTLVAEGKFSVQVEDFFTLFFSDASADFLEKFHTSCGDKDFQCGRWQRNAEFVHARDLSFRHPIKIYFGAKLGHCHTIQKFRIYRNSHLVIEASQQVNDVPYGDYFHVQVLWDVEKDVQRENSCLLRVYINVAFSRKTMWKGKIEQNTIDECREVYANWIDNAHQLLKERNLEEREGLTNSGITNINHDIVMESSLVLEHTANLLSTMPDVTASEMPAQKKASVADIKHGYDIGLAKSRGHEHQADVIVTNPDESIPEMLRQQQVRAQVESPNSSDPAISIFRGSLSNLSSYARTQRYSSLLIALFLLVLVLMQFIIIMLLTRTPEVRVISQDHHLTGLTHDRSEIADWVEKRVHLLSEEMNMMETRLERMRQEYSFLKGHLVDLQRSKHK